MNRRSNNNRKNKQESFQKIVVRCDALKRPVYEHEVCPQYTLKTGADSQKNCKNCRHSF